MSYSRKTLGFMGGSGAGAVILEQIVAAGFLGGLDDLLDVLRAGLSARRGRRLSSRRRRDP